MPYPTMPPWDGGIPRAREYRTLRPGTLSGLAVLAQLAILVIPPIASRLLLKRGSQGSSGNRWPTRGVAPCLPLPITT